MARLLFVTRPLSERQQMPVFILLRTTISVPPSLTAIFFPILPLFTKLSIINSGSASTALGQFVKQSLTKFRPILHGFQAQWAGLDRALIWRLGRKLCGLFKPRKM